MRCKVSFAPSWLNRCVAWIYTCVMAGILLLVLIVGEIIDFACKRTFDAPNICFFVAGVGLISFAAVLIRAFRENRKKIGDRTARFAISTNQLLLVLSALFTLVQIFCVYNYYFYTGWDVGGALIPSVEIWVHGTAEERTSSDYLWYQYYYSVYPNNLLTVFLLTVIRRIALAMGAMDVETGLMGYLVVECVLCGAAGYLLFQVIYSVARREGAAWAGWIFYLAFIGTSPWFSIPYTDAMGILFPILTAYLFIQYQSKGQARYLLALAACGYVAYQIKPQASFLFLAVLCSEGMDRLEELWKCNFSLRNFLQKAAAIAAGVAIAAGLCGAAVNSLGFTLDENYAYGWQHFLMMGMNGKTGGTYSGEDVEFSAGIENRAERERQNLLVVRDRLVSYGVAGTIKHFAKKLMTAFSDGSFAWEQEGTFYRQLYPDRNNFLSPVLKSIYYAGGKWQWLWLDFVQLFWMICLAGMAGAALFARQERKAWTVLRVLMIGVVGLVVFEMLFEVRARYLFTFTPIFIVLSVLGWQSIFRIVGHHLSKSRFLPLSAECPAPTKQEENQNELL